jgi:DNA-binding HxlR family transcriptional regulator
MVSRKKSPAPVPAVPLPAMRMVEDVVGCKWSLCVLDLIVRGVTRPGAMRKAVPGLSAKVLNERLRKLLRFGIIERRVFAEVPPHVEYRLSPFGRRFSRVIAEIRALSDDTTRAT